MKMSPPPVDYLRCLFPPNPDDGAGAQQPPCRPGKQNSSASAKAAARSQQRQKKASSGGYRHVPHKDKPPQMVARRNARERRRVQAVNTAFYNLRMAVPGDTNASRSEIRGKRVSKVKTLQRAIDYIYVLQDLLSSADESASSSNQDYTPNSSLTSDGASLSSGNVSSSTACCWGDCNNCVNCTNIAAYSNSQILIDNFQY